MNEEKTAQAIRNYNTLCSALDDHNWEYEKDDENFAVFCKVQGDDLPMNITLIVEAERQLFILLSHLNFPIPLDKRLDFAVAVSLINYNLIDGSFDFDIKEGNLYFKMTSSYIDSDIDKEVFYQMLYTSIAVIDEYNDKFLMLSKNYISLATFIKNETEGDN